MGYAKYFNDHHKITNFYQCFSIQSPLQIHFFLHFMFLTKLYHTNIKSIILVFKVLVKKCPNIFKNAM